jgi:hypothetical protein
MYSDEIDIFASYVKTGNKLARQSSTETKTKITKIINKINYIEEIIEKALYCHSDLKEILNTELTNLKNIINE